VIDAVHVLTTAQAIGDKWLVTDGLKDGDKVIVTGLQKVAPGMVVKPEEASDAPADASQAAPAK